VSAFAYLYIELDTSGPWANVLCPAVNFSAGNSAGNPSFYGAGGHVAQYAVGDTIEAVLTTAIPAVTIHAFGATLTCVRVASS
jgi:hypothetical protein